MVGKDSATGRNDIPKSTEVIIFLKEGDVDRIPNPFAERCDKEASETANSSPVTVRVGKEEAEERRGDQLYRRHVGTLVLGVFPLNIGFSRPPWQDQSHMIRMGQLRLAMSARRV